MLTRSGDQADVKTFGKHKTNDRKSEKSQVQKAAALENPRIIQQYKWYFDSFDRTSM